VHYYRHAKTQIRTQQASKLKADQSRKRFEAHQARKEQLESEKNTKRQARQNANHEINIAIKQTGVSTIEEPPVAQSPQELEAKLQRHRQSAQERLDRLTRQEAEELDTARKEKIAASIKQAQVRLSEAELKIAELNSTPSSEKAIAKLHASPHQIANQALTTLQKQLTITEDKLRAAQENNSPSLNALTLAVEKLQLKIQHALSEIPNPRRRRASPCAPGGQKNTITGRKTTSTKRIHRKTHSTITSAHCH
jgi:Na+-translocating ferredoxin:NAD+ oxidoreductase subunit C